MLVKGGRMMVPKGSLTVTDTFISCRAEKLFKGYFVLLQKFVHGLLKTVDATAAKRNNFL